MLTSTISDLTRSMTIVGSGEQVSPEMYQQQVGQNLVGFGKADPTGKCEVCRENTEAGSYGLGVVLLGPWITQTMNFGGTGATSGYLPSDELTISVATTYEADAFDSSRFVCQRQFGHSPLTAPLPRIRALPQPTG